ncbi:hypothetical protein MNBD_GAMMA09-824 [hydrothermal vent metagenome]|uniref:Uncharacterized protein n=1 Tax=hydrothermal vent metagenome TaxID=652676 RepID=A0A3B0X564_9ZZZZ
MMQYAAFFILFFFSSSVFSSDWKLISSSDGFWIKTENQNQHALLLAYEKNKPHFLLIVKTDAPSVDKPLSVTIKIDRGPQENSRLILLERRADKSIFRIEIDSRYENNYVARMIAGLNWSIYFEPGINNNKSIDFSLKGFTVAFNDLLIGNKIGSLQPAWLIKNRKDRELYCLLTTNISIQAMKYRLQGKRYADALSLIPETGYSIIDHNLGEIINQAYKIPFKNLPYEPAAEKYLMFSRCLAQPFEQR